MSKVQVNCPNCGVKLLRGTEVKETEIYCARCRTNFVVNLSDKKIEVSILMHSKFKSAKNKDLSTHV